MLDPRVLTLMHLETLDEPLTAKEVAFLLGNDPEIIRYAISLDREQESAWSAAALDEQLGDDPDPETATVNLGEARACARGVGLKRQALRLVLDCPPDPVEFPFADDLAEIRRWEYRWLGFHARCTRPWNATETCPEHGADIVDGRRRQREATEALLSKLRAAAADHPLEPEHLFNQR